MALLDDIRAASARVAGRARHVRIDATRLDPYAAELAGATPAARADDLRAAGADAEARAAFTICLDAINFGSGWFPTLRKRGGRSGYFTVAAGLRDRFAARGPWPAPQLACVEPAEIASWLGQDPAHELMPLFAAALREVGGRVEGEHGGRYLDLARSAPTAVGLVEHMATWPGWTDVSTHEGESVPFFKRAQILAADLHHAGVATFDDLARLTLFADNLVPHVLRLDGILELDPPLTARIDAGSLLEHGSGDEVELRACALHVVELLAARSPDRSAQELDYVLWSRGGGPRYKAVPRPRSRTTAY